MADPRVGNNTQRADKVKVNEPDTDDNILARAVREKSANGNVGDGGANVDDRNWCRVTTETGVVVKMFRGTRANESIFVKCIAMVADPHTLEQNEVDGTVWATSSDNLHFSVCRNIGRNDMLDK